MRSARWNEMSPTTRAVVVTAGVVDAGLRAWALADLRNRPAEQVLGPKAVWGLALTVVSSAGVLPAAYLLLGRRRAA
ncbi:hypothetical protein GCM10023168_37130 [Fodinibacter luteus]|uniref:DUF2834 domain-containing protein n=2 Tax=Fodinibacter luteus TaxID=552064 RepID=A0ABP8KSK6_9MICO